MTVYELIDMLSELDPDAPVRLATQRSHPLAATLAGAARDAQGVVWLLEGENTGYADADLWEGQL